MSFYYQSQNGSHPHRAALRESEYGFFLNFTSRDAICRELARKIDSQFSTVVSSEKIRPYRLEGITKDMNMILEAGNHADRRCRKEALADKFYVSWNWENHSTDILRKIPESNLYLESRYWNQTQTLAFCVAAQLPYDQAQKLLGPMLGQPWLYLRDPFTLVCDFALQTRLSAEDTALLLRETLDAVESVSVDPGDTNMTVHLRDTYSVVLEEFRAGNQKPCDLFRDFISLEKHNLRGDFARTSALIRDLICGVGAPKYNLSSVDSAFLLQYLSKTGESDEQDRPLLNTTHLSRQLARTFVPWERKRGEKRDEKRSAGLSTNLLAMDLDPSAYLLGRLRAYLKDKPNYRSIGVPEMRNDLIRILLMYTVTDIFDLNSILIDHSFCKLNPELPFDYLVCAALIYGSGPDKNDSPRDPYLMLEQLMDHYRGWAERRSRQTGGHNHEHE